MDIKALFELVKDGRFSILKYMLEKCRKEERDCYVNKLYHDQTTLLLTAIRHRHLEISKYLLDDCHCNIEQTGSVAFDGDTIEEATPLWLAAATGNLDIVKLLVERGANVNSTTKTKSSPLRASCYDGHFEVVKYLVENGADIELTNRHGHSCLMIASYKKNYKIVKFLLDQGANVNRRSSKGNTALHDASESGAVEIMKLLLDKGKGKMVEDMYKISPLLTASLNGSEGIVHLIINYEIDQFTGKADKSKRLCSELEKIHALELLGSTFIDKKRDICSGIQYWKLGLERRENNIKRILSNVDVEDGETVEMYQKVISEPNPVYNNLKEFSTLEELQQIVENVDDIKMQSLIVRERILGQTHVDTTYYCRYRGAVYADSGDFEPCIKLWLYALDKQQKSLESLSCLTLSSLFSFAELYNYMMSNKMEQVSFEEIFGVFKRALFELKSALLLLPNKQNGQNNNKYQFYKMRLLQRVTGNALRVADDCLEDELIRDVIEDNELNDFILRNNNVNNLNGINEQVLKNAVGVDNENLSSNKVNENQNELNGFHKILYIIQLFIGLLCRLKDQITNDQLLRLKKAVYQFVKLNAKGYNGFSPLHQVCFKDEFNQMIKFPQNDVLIDTEIMKLLIEVGANVNALDMNLNTPLHIAAQNKPASSIIKVLVENGAHLDLKNKFNQTPLDFLLENSAILNDYHIYPLRHLSLKCLCAQTITKNDLDYKDCLPVEVSKFVKIH